ncbi:MAG: BREX-3 system P-loop-containing protein BrxF [bacterium]
MDFLLKNIGEAVTSSEKLVLIVGRPGSGKSKLLAAYSKNTGIPIIDLSRIVANSSEDIKKTMKDFLKTYRFDVLLLDNKKPLYSLISTADLMDILKELSEEIIVISTWNGYIQDGQLSHIVNGQEETYPVDGTYQYVII